MRSSCLSSAIALVLAVGLVAASPPPLVAQTTDDELKAQSRALWRRGAQKYALAKWGEAIALFDEAYEVWPFPEILFNLCQAHRQAKSYERAIFFCRTYLRRKPDTDDQSLVLSLVEEMAQHIQQDEHVRRQPPEGVEPPPDDAAPQAKQDTTPRRKAPQHSIRVPVPRNRRTGSGRHWYGDWVGWALVGTGAAGVAFGAGFLLDAHSLDADADGERDQVEHVRLRDRADSRRTAGFLTLGAGTGLFVAGAIKLAMHDDHGDGGGVTEVAFGRNWFAISGRF